MITQPKVGDRITFKVPTRWEHRKVTRVVKRVRNLNSVEVTYGGWDRFVVFAHEISELEER